MPSMTKENLKIKDLYENMLLTYLFMSSSYLTFFEFSMVGTQLSAEDRKMSEKPN